MDAQRIDNCDELRCRFGEWCWRLLGESMRDASGEETLPGERIEAATLPGERIDDFGELLGESLFGERNESGERGFGETLAARLAVRCVRRSGERLSP